MTIYFVGSTQKITSNSRKFLFQYKQIDNRKNTLNLANDGNFSRGRSTNHYKIFFMSSETFFMIYFDKLILFFGAIYLRKLAEFYTLKI